LIFRTKTFLRMLSFLSALMIGLPRSSARSWFCSHTEASSFMSAAMVSISPRSFARSRRDLAYRFATFVSTMSVQANVFHQILHQAFLLLISAQFLAQDLFCD